MAAQERISVYNLADLKHTSDDAIPNYLNSLKFKQINTLTDVRLALGYGAFAISAACFAWDYKFGFESTKLYTAIAVALYTILNSALTLWIWLVEKNTVYEGVAPSGEKISISTSTKKNVPIYNVSISIQPKTGKPSKIELSRPFAEWFDVAGHFIAAPFQTMFASNVSAIGKLDAKRANPAIANAATASASVEAPDQKYSAEMLEMLSGGPASGTDMASSTGSVSKKGGKRRKA